MCLMIRTAVHTDSLLGITMEPGNVLRSADLSDFGPKSD
jgi:hypothetical protein